MNKDNMFELAKRLKLITVEDMCQFTIAQLVYMVANKVNELITEVGEIEDNVQNLLEQGTLEEIEKVFDKWVKDGTFDHLINQSGLKKVNDELDKTILKLSEVEGDIQLINAECDGLNNKINNLADGSPKGVYANLDALRASKPTGDTGIFITSDNGHWNYWNGTAWVSGGTYQSATIGENTITPDMMAFPVATAFKTSNLFNKEEVERGKYINEAGNAVTPLDGSDRCSSNFIPVLGGIQYTASDTFTHFAFYTDGKVFISQNATPSNSFVTPSNASYVRLTIFTNQLEMFSLEKGESATSGNPYYQAVIGNHYITDGMLVNKYVSCNRTSNLFNKDTAIKGKYIRWTDGSLETPVVPGDYYASDFIEVKPSTTYIVKHQSQSAFYDKNYSYISGMDSGVSATFTTPATAKYFRITLTSEENVLTQQIVEGDSLPNYKPYFLPDIPRNTVNYEMLTPELKELIDENTNTGLKINFIGDSITWGYEAGTGNRVSKPYPTVVEELLHCSVNNYGISGSTIAGDGTNKGYLPIWKRYNEMSQDVTLNVVFAGTNDFGSDRQIQLGAISDTDGNSSFYGGLNVLCEGLITNFPNSRIVLIAPMQRGSDSTNNYGQRLIDYVDAVINVGAKYSIPVIDLYRCGNMPLMVDSFRENYSSDGLHLNQKGYERLGQVIANHVKNM